MFLAKVTKKVVAVEKHPAYAGKTVYVVQPVLPDGTSDGHEWIAMDYVQAAIGDTVVCGGAHLVAVNLYPFEETVAKADVTYADAIENIDIGGVTLIRAAAKNHERVTLICDPADYNSVLAEIRAGGISAQTRTKLAIKGFASTAHYDTAIHAYLNK